MNSTRAAVIQAAPILFDSAKTLEKLGELAADAARLGSQVAVFPEAFVGGYPKGLDFGARVGLRTPEGREHFRRYFEGAIGVPGAATEAIGKAAKAAGMYLVVGVIERDGGTLYCTVLFVGPRRPVAGQAPQVDADGDGAADLGLRRRLLVDGGGHAVGPNRRGDLLGKLHAAVADGHVRQGGATLLRTDRRRPRNLAPHDAAHRARRTLLRLIGVPVSGAGTPADGLPAGIDARNQRAALIRGGSCIIGPLGQVLAGPTFDTECILTAELDLDEIVRGKFDLDVVGHYARPDVFQLTVNETAARAVTTVETGPMSDAVEN